jgi:ferrous iron transport protein B
LVMMGLYLLGTVMALIVAWVMKWFIKLTEKSFFILELPVYRAPRWKNALTTMIEKAKIFVFQAGKIIMVISLLLWVLSTFGPAKNMAAVTTKYQLLVQQNPQQATELNRERKTALLENSFAGTLGKYIEPAIRPLGYDWKIGIALIVSFAAREVFVGTMATLYSVGEDASDNSSTLRQKMNAAVRADGTKVYNLATGLSLLVFYVLAMQCMSTLAVVKRETRSWKWPLIQLVYMTGLAYLLSWGIYNIFV